MSLDREGARLSTMQPKSLVAWGLVVSLILIPIQVLSILGLAFGFLIGSNIAVPTAIFLGVSQLLGVMYTAQMACLMWE